LRNWKRKKKTPEIKERKFTGTEKINKQYKSSYRNESLVPSRTDTEETEIF
jgi:hypothetical protein